jgi:Spy/CpxP family protein refolding chaperone
MKSIILTVCLSVFSFLAFAQKKAPLSSAKETQPTFTVPMMNTWLGRFEKRQTKMIQLLGLSTEQKHSLDTFNDHYVTQRATLQEDKSVSVKTRTEKIKLLSQERETKFKNLLTPEQLNKWNDLRKGQKKKTFRKK